MEGQLRPFLAPGQLQLAGHGFLIHPDAHGGDLKGPLQNGVPHENVAVEGPVVIVGGTAVMLFAGSQLAADLHEEHGVVLGADGVLPLLGGLVRPAVLQLLGGDEVHLPVQLYPQAGEGHIQRVAGFAHGGNDGPDGGLQIRLVPVLPGDDLLPVPLVHIDGVDVVQIVLVPADGVHIGVKALAHVEAVALQGQALPLGQGVDHLGVLAPDAGDVEPDGTLRAVQVVVQTGVGSHEQGGGHPAQVQGVGKVGLKGFFDKGNGPLQFIVGQGGLVALGDHKSAHKKAPSFSVSSACPDPDADGAGSHPCPAGGRSPRHRRASPACRLRQCGRATSAWRS